MTRVGWLADESSQIGGAELTQAEFRAAAPEGVEVIDCPAGEVDRDCDAYVIQNCVKYDTADLAVIKDRPAVKYWHDVGPWLQAGVRGLLDEHATPICCSPIQAQYMGLDAALVPPPVDLGRFQDAAKGMNGNRAGAVSIGSWRNYGKAPHKAAEWAKGDIDFFGDGVLAPPGATAVRYEDMPALMARYRTFVFLPTVIEPFGRLVAEAWASGLEVVTNRLVGSLHWIENDPDAIETSAHDFWQIALRDCK
jgi:hypothetical protein